MGLIIFLIAAPILAVAVATYLLLDKKVIPPYQAPTVEDNWPFPNGPKP